MIIKNLYAIVLWMKVASALEGLVTSLTMGSLLFLIRKDWVYHSYAYRRYDETLLFIPIYGCSNERKMIVNWPIKVFVFII